MGAPGTVGYTRGYTRPVDAYHGADRIAAFTGSSKWAQQDSNLRPADYESCPKGSARVRYRPFCRIFSEWPSATIRHFPPGSYQGCYH
jgi:hypothetical protein